jgi:hypothetical protein
MQEKVFHSSSRRRVCYISCRRRITMAIAAEWFHWLATSPTGEDLLQLQQEKGLIHLLQKKDYYGY